MDSIKCSRAEAGPEGDRERGGKPWYNLLIVDDEPLILESLYHMLVKRYGRKFLIYQAASADEALEQFKSIRVDLLMTDIRMPRYGRAFSCQDRGKRMAGLSYGISYRA